MSLTMKASTAPATSASNGLVLMAVLALYLGVITLLRFALTGSVGLDDAEQLVWSQQLQLGYGTQPPLFTWLLWLLFQLFGVKFSVVVVFRELLLAGILITSYLAALESFNCRRTSLLAVLLLMLYPQLLIDFHKEATHTLLLSLSCALTFYLGLLLIKRQTFGLYLGLGLCIGMGMLSKYSYVIFASGLLLASLSMAEGRKILLDRRIPLTAGAALLVTLPHLYWALLLAPDTMASVGVLVSSETGRMDDPSRLAIFASGNLDLLRAALGTVGPMLLIVGLVYFSAFRSNETETGSNVVSSSASGQLALRLLIFQWMLFALGIVIFGSTKFHTHWMAPLLLTAPIALLTALSPLLTPKVTRRLLSTALSIVLLIPALWFMVILIPDQTRHYERITAPFAELAKNLRDQGFQHGTVVSPSGWIAGNLRLHFPNNTVTTSMSNSSDLHHGPFVYVAESAKRDNGPADRESSESLVLMHHYSQKHQWHFDYRLSEPIK